MCSVHKYFKSFYLQSHESFIVMEDFVSLGCGGFLGKRICLLLKTLLNDFRIGYSTLQLSLTDMKVSRSSPKSQKWCKSCSYSDRWLGDAS